MATDVKDSTHESGGGQPRDSSVISLPPKRSVWVWLGLVVCALAALGAGAFVFFAEQGHAKKGKGEHVLNGEAAVETTATVKVVRPRQGGMARVTSQPGTIRAYEYADLYTKVSGFIKELNVDRGSPVKEGQLLAVIYDPERDVAVLQAKAALDHSRAQVTQSDANIKTAEAMVAAAMATKKEARAIHDKAIAQRDYRKKEYARISDLVVKRAAEKRLEDEEYDNYMSAEADVMAGVAGIETADAKLAEAKAKLELANADLKVAKAKVQLADADLKLANVFVEYTRILSPYEGFVTVRGEGVHRGAFVRAATESGSHQPLLTVAYTKKMRTIVPVPDNQVPYVKVGNPATVTLDALAGREFPGSVSLISESEDLNDRTMRVEVNLDNPDGVLRDGMFGRATILLEKEIKNWTLPSSCLVDRNGKGEGAILVVKDGKIHKSKVHVGMDTGVRAEIIDGVNAGDVVVLQPDTSMSEGGAVHTEEANPA
jgi:HlyD family secretion protein